MIFEGRQIEVVTRAGWNARHPTKPITSVAIGRKTEFIVHHSGGPAMQSVRAIQDWCMDKRGFRDIDYNLLIDQHGKVYLGRGWAAVGSQAIGHNTAGIGVCVIGRDQLSPEARVSLRWLYTEAIRKAGHKLTIRGHRDVDQTDCPGDRITTWMRHGWLDPRELRYEPEQQLHGEDVRDVQGAVHGLALDGVFGPRTDAAVRSYQALRGLDPDGRVGPLTRAAMLL